MTQQRTLASAELKSIYLDIVLNNLLLRGRLRELDEGGRLVDILNSQDAMLTLYSVKVSDWMGNTIALLPDMGIEKQHILAAVPTETEDYKRQRRMSAFGVAHPTLKAIPVLALLPPLVVKGIAYVQPTVRLLRPDSTTFSRFLPLTDAELTLPTQRTISAAILVVNRDMMAAITAIQSPESFPT